MDDALDRLRAALGSARSLTGSPPPFDADTPPADPVRLFADWFAAAVDAGVPEPHAVTLSTVDAAGVPDARVLVLKDVTDDGSWTFASSASSAKGRQLADRPVAALTFSWQAQARAIRLRGSVTTEPEPVRRADFAARSASARAVALAGGQSEPLNNIVELHATVEAAADRLRREPDAVADDWTVWALHPDLIEFWQGDVSREHLRLQYRRSGDGWSAARLRP
ncbi:pyridoxal 5'-phosphate synthase [uncultured Amnibacterium sp.]|uniref:pyridoxine/pyridoxamine 5'-phosphate oxidase n=1 Tax=uncultured Amnibacterium sp. TaxID=1631851 RepID=UPI0035CAE9B2